MSGTSHLREPEYIDLLDGTLPAARRSHLDGCAACRQQAEDLRTTMARARDLDVPEPPPFYWEQLSARVRASVASQPEPGTRLWGALRLTAPRIAAAAVAASLLLAVMLWRFPPAATDDSGAAARSGASAPLAADHVFDEDVFGDIEADQNWALVRTVADDLPSDAIDAEGIDPRPGSAEALAYRMSDQERIALAQLLEDEMKGSKRPEAAS